MSSSPSSVEQAEMVLSDSEMRSVVSWSNKVWEVSAISVTEEMVERGSGERGRTAESVGERDRAWISKFFLPVITSPFLIFCSGELGELGVPTCLFSGLSHSRDARLEL